MLYISDAQIKVSNTDTRACGSPPGGNSILHPFVAEINLDKIKFEYSKSYTRAHPYGRWKKILKELRILVEKSR